MSTGPNATSALDFSQYAGLRAGAQQNDPATIKKVAQQFESLFTQMLLKSMRATKFGDDMTGTQGDFYKDMFDQQLATHLSTSGKGLGLSDVLVRQLGGIAQTAATTAASAATGGLSNVAISAATAAYRAVAGSSDNANVEATASADGGSWLPKNAQEFIDAVKPHAEKAAAALGVSAKAIIAQAALETGWGQHMGRNPDGSSSFNLFGIKASGNTPSVTQSTTEYVDGKPQTEQADFRSYGSIGQAFDDYVQFLKGNPRYAQALRAGTDVHGFAHGLQQAGYATDPAYAQKLVRVAASVAGATRTSA